MSATATATARDSAFKRIAVSRRRALSGAFAAAAATVAYEVTGAPQAHAATGQPIIAGDQNYAESTTALNYTSNVDQFGLYVSTDGPSPSGLNAAIGGLAFDTGDGVYGESLQNGVHGVTDGGQNGVFGESSGAGSGVYGQNNSGGYGVAGRADNGVGVFAASSAGVALRVIGKAHFNLSSVAHIAAGVTSKRVSVDGVTPTSMVLATIQKHVPGMTVEAATPTTGYVTIHLNQPAPTGGVNVAWIALD